MRILLLEPNRIFASQVVSYLASQGYEVVCRQDAQSGILAADESMPDIVIVELSLAGHSGIEFLYEFRSYNDWLKVPAIILSAVTKISSGIQDETFAELGVAAYLYKPDTPLDKLGLTLRHLLVNHGQL